MIDKNLACYICNVIVIRKELFKQSSLLWSEFLRDFYNNFQEQISKLRRVFETRQSLPLK